MIHNCHALHCTTVVPPKMLMCVKHWRMVPRPLQDAVYRHYQLGQERTKRPTLAYLAAAKAAIFSVAVSEGHIESR